MPHVGQSLVKAAGTPKISTFSDTFPTGDTNWLSGGSTGYSVTLSSNQMTMSLPAASDYLWVLSSLYYDWTNGACYINVTSFGTQSTGNIVRFGAEDNTGTNQVYFQVASSVLYFYKNVADTITSMGSVALNATTMAWLRIRESRSGPLTGECAPIPAPSYPMSVSVGTASAADLYSAPRQWACAALMSCTLPGSTWLDHTGEPVGSARICTLPPWVLCLPEYHR
jgi:hypothetical protein